MFPERRMRRLRSRATTRALFTETSVHQSDLIYPLFVEDRDEPVPIQSMPGVYRYPVEDAVEEAKEAEDLGIPAVLLFGVPAEKDERGTAAHAEEEAVQRALRRMREETDLTLIADTCLCEYTSHGHCGPIDDHSNPSDSEFAQTDEVSLEHEGPVNDETLDILKEVAVSQADAGADVVAPSGMMDGMVTAIREALDDAGHTGVAIMSYSAKYASGFYGPFREAAGSEFEGHRLGYQMNPGQIREARLENELDVYEGADVLMVKPAMPYLDIIKETRQRFDVPVAAYQVSGEYSMLVNAVENDLLPRSAIPESILGIRRAGADVVITYFAKEVVKSGEIS